MTSSEFRILFNAVDYDRSVRFYVDLLGMQVLEQWDRPDGKGTIVSAAANGQAIIEIFGRQGGPALQVPDPSLELTIAMDLPSPQEVDTFYLRLLSISKTTQEYGFQMGAAPSRKPWGHHSFTLADPNGIKVTFYAVIAG